MFVCCVRERCVFVFCVCVCDENEKRKRRSGGPGVLIWTFEVPVRPWGFPGFEDGDDVPCLFPSFRPAVAACSCRSARATITKS